MVEFGSSRSKALSVILSTPIPQGLLNSIPGTLKGRCPKYIPGSPPSLLDAPTECRFID